MARARAAIVAVWAIVVPAARAGATLVRTRILPAIAAFLRVARARLGPALRTLAARLRVLAGRVAARLGPALRSGAGRARTLAARSWARLDARGRAAVLGATSLLVVVVVVGLGMGRGGNPLLPQPSDGPGPSPAATQLSPEAANALLANVLPTPSTTDTVLLVANPASLSPGEQRWLSDLRGRLGNVDALAYREASVERLGAYFVVFVIDRSADLDPAVLAAAFGAGATVHLIGPAAAYQAQVAGRAP